MRAPWRWEWQKITVLLLLLGAGFAFCTAWPLLWNGVGIWLFLWIRAGNSQPRSPTVVRAPSGGKEAGHEVEHDRTGIVHTVYEDRKSRRHKV